MESTTNSPWPPWPTTSPGCTRCGQPETQPQEPVQPANRSKQHYSRTNSTRKPLPNGADGVLTQTLKPMEKLADMLLRHLEGILNYCRTKVPLGVIEAVKGNIKALLGHFSRWCIVGTATLRAHDDGATLFG